MFKSDKLNSHLNDVKIYDKILFGAAFVLAFFFMSHPDLWETANHSYVFLECLFDGQFMNFYDYCAAHNNSYYYINVANYNIVIYIIFGLWELPVFIINSLFGLAMNEQFIIYWAKLVPVAFFVGCGFMVKKICEALDMDSTTASTAALFFLFNPVAFYSPMAMGQYDTLCLFFTLWAVLWYIKGDLTRFSLLIGLGVVCKFFALLVFVPLILVAEKRILHIIKNGVMAMWLYIPTSLLFWGRTGNAKVFTQAMIDRMFKLTYETGIRGVSIFTLFYAMLVFACFVYVPKSEKIKKYLAVYLPMVAFGWLFNGIYWHPQWIVLMVPFMVITTFTLKSRSMWFYLDIVFAVGYFLHCFYEYSSQTGAILFDGGLLHHVFGMRVITSELWRPLNYFLSLIPYVWVLTPVMFTGAILLSIIFKFPVGETALSDKLSNSESYDKIPLKVFGYGIFAAGFICVWLLPSVFEALNAFGAI
ncbi:MAG: hypothetical protein J6K30_08885 [Oscillospiraceae bacterium]|nr:hypothetical protein [Oscillospiraceae bacterium]